MKIISLALVLSACGSTGATSNQTPYYSMTWSCNGNSLCERNMGSNGAAGSFTSESDCLAWETAFINNYKGATVTSCTYQQ